MDIIGNSNIEIIKGDTYQLNITLEGVELKTISNIYFSSKSLDITKELVKQQNEFKLILEPNETIKFKIGSFDYDLTIKFVDDKIKTIIYRSFISILPKINEVNIV